MEKAIVEEYVNVPKQEYNLLKEIFRSVKRQAFLVRIDEAERSFKAGNFKTVSVDDFINSIRAK
ncbi:MAG TPA: hypothetical protein PLG94_18355 [Smithellaceae bacterium]|nr:hypothetical protein [Smithellaceae bacterium]